MRNILAISLMLAFVLPALAEPTAPKAKPLRVAAVCFSTGEQTSGFNKICFYDCLGSQAAITISATSICPISINR